MLVLLMLSIAAPWWAAGCGMCCGAVGFAWILTLGCLAMTFCLWLRYWTQSPGNHGAFLRLLMATFLTMGTLGIEIADRIG